MGRGRRFVPPSTNEGIWFRHRGAESAGSFFRSEHTSTGDMLSAPFQPGSESHPKPPPVPFRAKTSVNYRTSNRFSEHDNRHAFQDHGVYFGDGQDNRQLGRTLVLPHVRLHNTDPQYLKHRGKEVVDYDYHSTYQNSFKGKNTEEPPRCRRFQKSLTLSTGGSIPLDTSTTNWHPSSEPSHQTNTQVLAVSQEPFLAHNSWKYSYNPIKNVYPQYDQKAANSRVENALNRYGAAFSSTSSVPS